MIEVSPVSLPGPIRDQPARGDSSHLAAIQTAPAPLNRARLWHYDPAVGGVAPTGRLAVAGPALSRLEITIDGTHIVSLDHSSVRGGWLRISPDGHYYLDVDIGERRHPIQVGGPGDLPTRSLSPAKPKP
jgi:hypothetical protein